jgi:protein gp37
LDKTRERLWKLVLYAVGKKVAGRRLDGRTWDQLPTAMS